MYEETFNEVLIYEKSDAKNENVRDQFTNSMTNILNRHRSVVELVAHGVMEYKGAKTIEEEKIQYFLDRFYISRIAIRFLINQHGKEFVQLFKSLQLWSDADRPLRPCSWLIFYYFKFQCLVTSVGIQLSLVHSIRSVICEGLLRMLLIVLKVSAKHIISVHQKLTLRLSTVIVPL